jgi:hypothetical protein
LTWDAICTVAERVNDRYSASGLHVIATRRRSLWRWVVVEGLSIWDEYTDVFEPVRSRRPFTVAWIEIQSVASAASHVGAFLRDRPDLNA